MIINNSKLYGNFDFHHFHTLIGMTVKQVLYIIIYILCVIEKILISLIVQNC